MRLRDQILGPPHSPTRCQVSGGRLLTAGFAAGLTGVQPDSIDTSCDCPCRGCQRGECRLTGAPPLTPRQREAAKKRVVERRLKRWATQKVFEDYDMPPDRTSESFRFTVEFLWAEVAVDTYYTDDEDEADRLTGAALRRNYEARVTERNRHSGAVVVEMFERARDGSESP